MPNYYIAYTATGPRGRCSSYSVVASTVEADQDKILAAVRQERPELADIRVTEFRPA